MYSGQKVPCVFDMEVMQVMEDVTWNGMRAQHLLDPNFGPEFETYAAAMGSKFCGASVFPEFGSVMFYDTCPLSFFSDSCSAVYSLLFCV